MYEHQFGLAERPFELTPDPRFLYETPAHREALSNLEYGLSTAKSVTVVIGKAGTGKTTLLQAAMASRRCRMVTCVQLNNPTLRRHEFLELLAGRFGLSAAAAGSKAAFLQELERLLHERRSQGRVVALVVDEAQRLSAELLEEVRLLGNMETSNDKLLPLVLAGQPELAVRLEDLRFSQLKQRVALRCELFPFTLNETAGYIATRIRQAGGTPSDLFTLEAVRSIHEYSSGIPRTINVICDNALVTAMALGRKLVDLAMVSDVCRDFALQHSTDGATRVSDLDTITSEADERRPPDSESVEDAGEPPRRSLFADLSRPRFALFGRRSGTSD
jgi:general secretion pathway protein A